MARPTVEYSNSLCVFLRAVNESEEAHHSMVIGKKLL